MRASPVGQRTSNSTSGMAQQASSSSGPAARWMAPSTPPPPSSVSLAALTMASTALRVRSPNSRTNEQVGVRENVCMPYPTRKPPLAARGLVSPTVFVSLCTSHKQLLVAEGVDGVKPRGFPGRVVAEDDSDDDRDGYGSKSGDQGRDCRPT